MPVSMLVASSVALCRVPRIAQHAVALRGRAAAVCSAESSELPEMRRLDRDGDDSAQADGPQWEMDLDIRVKPGTALAPNGVDDAYDPAEDDQTYPSVREFLPELMRVKYGEDWELLLASDDEADAADMSDDTAPLYVDEYAAGDDGGSDEDPELLEQVRRVEMGQGVSGEEEEEEEEEEETEEALALRRQLAIAAGELPFAGVDVSPTLAAFVAAVSAGEEDVPEAYPASEWAHVFATAMEDKRFIELQNTWANLRVLLHANFADVAIPVDADDELEAEARALMKARAVFEATGLPTLAECTSMHVMEDGARPPSETLFAMDDEAEQLLDRMRPSSPPDRPVLFRCATAFVSADATCTGRGQLTMPLGCCALRHHTIATSAACDDLFVQVAEKLGLKFVGTDGFDDFYQLQQLKKGGRLRRKTAGALLLKEKLLREATLLDASILKVSSFINHMVDVELMEACGDELAERLEETQPTKVLTVEATGLLPAMFVAKALGLPVVFARKSRQIGISDSYQTSYKSVTSSKATDLYVSTDYLSPGDRVIIIDDFLAGGTTADALVRVCRMAGASVVGGGFLIEKLNDAGRAFLSGYQVQLESLAMVDVADGRIQIVDSPSDDGKAEAVLADTKTFDDSVVLDGVLDGLLEEGGALGEVEEGQVERDEGDGIDVSDGPKE